VGWKSAHWRLVVAVVLLSAAAVGTVAGGEKAPRRFTAADFEGKLPPEPNPYLSFLPAGVEPDWEYWRARMQWQALARREARAGEAGARFDVVEVEEAGLIGVNDLPLFGQAIDGFGTTVGQSSEVRVFGHLQVMPRPLGTFSEPDGAIPLAHQLTVVAGERVILDAFIGDGAYGSSGPTPSGDFDFFAVEAAAGQVISARVRTPEPLDDLNPILGVYDGAGKVIAFNDDLPLPGIVSSYDAWVSVAAPADGWYFVCVGGFTPWGIDLELLPADPFDPASGPGAGSEGEYELILGRDFRDPGDVDFFRFELREGDVIGATVAGGGQRASLVSLDSGELVTADRRDLSGIYPEASPLPGGGLGAVAYVIEAAGSYAVGIDRVELGSTGDYVLELGVYRPTLGLEEEEATQILFLDFNGATIDPSGFGLPPGLVNLSPLESFLPAWGLSSAELDAVIEAIVAEVEENLSRDVRLRGLNGDHDASGIDGEFDIEIRSSRSYPDPFGQANVSRVIVGGTCDELGFVTIGISEAIDPGNFDTAKTSVVLLDLLSAPWYDPSSLNGIPRDPALAMVELVGHGVGLVVAHEAGHLFANFHTARDVGPATLMDRGGNMPQLLGVGADGVAGSVDDEDVDLGPDLYEPVEAFTGTENTLNAVSFDLPAGGPRPDIAVVPAWLDFGAVAVGDQVTRPVAISNQGSRDLTLWQLLVLGPDAGDFDLAGPAIPQVLAPLELTSVDVTFAPTAPGPAEATLAVASDDPDQGLVEVALAGQGGVPSISVTPDAHDYGEIVYGDAGANVPFTFTVANTADGALQVTASVVTGADPDGFTVDAGGAPFTLAGGESRPVLVSFRPAGRTGAMSAVLRFASNDPAVPYADVTLQGLAWGPDIDVQPASPFVFGAMVPGTHLWHDFTVGNLGNSDLVAARPQIVGPDAADFAITSGAAPFTLVPGESWELRVSFDADALGERTATLRIASNDPDEDPLDVLLYALVAWPEIWVFPEAHYFGEVPVGGVASTLVVVRNLGGVQLTATASLTGPDVAEFTLDSGGGFFALSPGGFREIGVSFRPTSPGLKRAVLRLESSDPERPVVEVDLIGGRAAAIPALSLTGIVVLVALLAAAGLLVLHGRPLLRSG